PLARSLARPLVCAAARCSQEGACPLESSPGGLGGVCRARRGPGGVWGGAGPRAPRGTGSTCLRTDAGSRCSRGEQGTRCERGRETERPVSRSMLISSQFQS
ncbi:hypothetical protein LEMLEM_LOCUS15854, partial [Lemmus lemmus]